MFVVQAGLGLRNRARSLFANGDYVPLAVTGSAADHLVAFARVLGDDAAIVIAPRFPLELLRGQSSVVPSSRHWADTTVDLPSSLQGARFRNIFTEETFTANASLPVKEVLARFPVATLARQR